MPACTDPGTAHRYGNDVVELKGNNSSAAASCLSNDLCAIFTPGKMLLPFLQPGIEQWCNLVCQWINPLILNAFVTVAQRAGQSEILLITCATQSTGHNMLYLQRGEYILLLAQAVATTILRHVPDAAFYFTTDIGGCHALNGGWIPRSTASAKASALRNKPC